MQICARRLWSIQLRNQGYLITLVYSDKMLNITDDQSIAVQSNNENEGRESAVLLAQTLWHHNMSCAVG